MARLDPLDRRQPVGAGRDHEAIDVAGERKPCAAVAGDVESARRHEGPNPAITRSSPDGSSDEEDLEQRFVAVQRDFPIVQSGRAGNRLAVNPEILGFA